MVVVKPNDEEDVVDPIKVEPGETQTIDQFQLGVRLTYTVRNLVLMSLKLSC